MVFIIWDVAEHAKNIANLKLLNEINEGLGGAYKPSNPLYDLAAMVAKHSTRNTLQGDVNEGSMSVGFQFIPGHNQIYWQCCNGLAHLLAGGEMTNTLLPCSWVVLI